MQPASARQRRPHRDVCKRRCRARTRNKSRLLFPENGPPPPTRRRSAIEPFSSSETVEHRGSGGNAPAALRGDKVTISWTCGGGATLPAAASPARHRMSGVSNDRQPDQRPGWANQPIPAVRQSKWIMRWIIGRSRAGRRSRALPDSAARRESALTLDGEIGKDVLDPVEPRLAWRHA